MRYLFAVLIAVLSATRAGAGGPSAMKIGVKAPGFSCPVLGRTDKKSAIVLRDLLAKNQVVVLAFFEIKCKPAMDMIPRLVKVLAGKDGAKVAGLLVYVGTEDDAAVKTRLGGQQGQLPVLMDRHGLRVGEPYRVVVDDVAHVPQVMVIGRNGILRSAEVGFPVEAEDRLSKLIDTLVAESNDPAPGRRP